ncbi:hypothetical protein NNJEOMEG_02572 [Fundidesulfovibrio magnetotacticus]|uniref:KilA-N domain-containing protein n=1 Tax=Fundidesulfovibrio magnetotacticus TaxID=2730080 RepID=A0A6V8M2R1_9BACT|nr:KilA-N domain-containing protein [Fundidesulfovibrio magnetotacticus]GFK94725.1 hypothetical protein NNJEOMEG_02572 [Fundidesulfovibrio magnetotacticus]
MYIRTNPDNPELISLTDLHRASGGEMRNHPTKWLANDSTSEFILQVRKVGNLQKSEVLTVKAGRNGGTYAHWQCSDQIVESIQVVPMELRLAKS